MLYKPLAFLTENSTRSSLFNIAKRGRGRREQGVPRLLTNPVATNGKVYFIIDIQEMFGWQKNLCCDENAILTTTLVNSKLSIRLVLLQNLK